MIAFLLALTFADAWRLALSGPRGKIPDVQVQQARVSFYQSLTGILPWGSLSARYTSAFTPPPSLPLPVSPDRYYSHVFTLRLVLFSPAWIEEAIAARARLTDQELARRQARYDLYVQVAQAYARAWQAQEALKLRKARMESAELALRSTRKRMELGAATELDLLNAQYAFLQAQTLLQQAEKDARDALDELAALLGVDSLSDTLTAPALSPLPLPSPEQEPGYLRAEKSRFYAGLSFLSGIASFLPEVSMEWTWSKSAYDLPAWSELTRDQRYLDGWTISLQFSLDRYLFGLWSRKENAHLAGLQARSAYLSALAQARSLAREETLLVRQEEERRMALEVARKAHELAEKRYALGEISLLELFQAQDQYLEAREAWIAFQAQKFVHRARRAWEVIP